MKPFQFSCFVIALTICGLHTTPAAPAKDPFAEFVRSTEPRTPAEEQKGFHVPPGFEVQLFAAEPEIGKPMNMAFDARGRLWITQSREYPFPAPKDRKGLDEIKILEDTDGDGHADKITTFAEGLNIPIGLYPYRNGVIAFSIPNISYYEDTDGDGKADKQQFLYGPFGFDRDTHGLTSNFRRGFDGWLYACHGFNNNTTIKGTDGQAITMNSGNTYRMKVDGSHVEYFTHGQVNPFGLMFDPLGNLYSADCHSSPIYQLQRGGHYPSFGKPDDGLGFGPAMMTHSHGSTAIGGIVFYTDQNFPPEFQSNIFVGNVMTCRINRDRLEDHGATRLAKEQADLLSSDDPWFRPVDLQLGPDGAVYVADFYNRIIGHYEVPLTHPGRDRERGRIWRIIYHPDDTKKVAPRRFDFTKASTDELVEALADPHYTYRMLAMTELVDRIGSTAIAALQKAFDSSRSSFQKIHSLWTLRRLGAHSDRLLQTAASDSDPMLRVHAMRALSESANFPASERKLASAGLKDANGFVQKTAADALAEHPAFENVAPLLDLLRSVLKEDTHLRYVARMALRNQLAPDEIMQRVSSAKWNEADRRALADVAVAVTNSPAAGFLLAHIQSFEEPRDTVSRYLKHIVRYIPQGQLDSLAGFVQKKFGDDIDLQATLFKSVQEGVAQRGVKLSDNSRAWGIQLARKLLKSVVDPITWLNTPVEGVSDTVNPWVTQSRKCADGKTGSFLSSLPNGEQLTGVLRSPTFAIPPRLTFFLAGHDGFPDKPLNKKNLVRLCLASDQSVVSQTPPPRNDTAQKITWDLSKHQGEKGYIELIDGDTAGAYAWLAAGRFNPEVVQVPAGNPSQVSQRQQAGADLVRTLKARELEPEVQSLFASKTDGDTRFAAARAFTAIAPATAVPLVAQHLNDAEEPMSLREKLTQALGEVNSSQAASELVNALRTAAHRLEVKIAQALAGTASGAEQLLAAVEARKASPQLLQEKSVKEKFAVSKAKDWEQRVATLTKSLSPPDAERQKLIDQRRTKFKLASANPSAGARTFEQTCAVCHQIDGKGGLIGPQLDGVANRGAERIIEDILDPNRNVDGAFRYSNITLEDDRVISGLQRREEGETVVFADSTGKEITVTKKQIKEKIQSELSLMPDNFGEVISAEDFNNLLAFLLSKGVKPTTPK